MLKMVERKLFKTKLCVLYQKGHCPRQSCSFAHGEAELRRFSGSINGRRGHRGGDMRDKLDRRRSPLRRYSPGRDAGGRHAFRGYSPTSPLGKRRKLRKKQQLDGENDFSGSMKISDATENRSRDRKMTSDSKGIHKEQLRQVRADISMLDNHKCQLEVYLEERVQEVDCLTSRIQELEMQLSQEKEECRRTTSKIKKFIKAHNRYLRLQDELKRSQDRLQKLGDQLVSDAARLGTNEEDSSINILSDGEITGNHLMSPLNQLPKETSPSRKRLRMNVDAAEELKLANLRKGEGTVMGTIRLEKRSRWNAQHDHSNASKEAEVEDKGNTNDKIPTSEDRPKRGKTVFTTVHSAEKIKGPEPDLIVPPTSMAAHAVDEVSETIEMEGLEVAETASAIVGKGAKNGIPGLPSLVLLPPPLPPPPPPPIPHNTYSQYQAEDENAHVEPLEEEAVDVDIV